MFKLLRQLGYIAAAAIVCFYVFIVLRGPQGVPAMLEKRQQLEKMQRENDALREEIRKKKTYIRQLETNKDVRERAIREQTLKQKSGETTIYLAEPAPAPGPGEK